MKKTIVIVAALVLLAGIPVLAGDHGCKASTQNCLDKMAVDLTSRGLIGVDGEWEEESGGYRVESYISGTNAREAGVELGDLLVAINGIALSDEEKTEADRENRTPGSEVTVTVLREGKKKKMKVTLSALTREQAATYVGYHMMKHALVAEND